MIKTDQESFRGDTPQYWFTAGPALDGLAPPERDRDAERERQTETETRRERDRDRERQRQRRREREREREREEMKIWKFRGRKRLFCNWLLYTGSSPNPQPPSVPLSSVFVPLSHRGCRSEDAAAAREKIDVGIGTGDR